MADRFFIVERPVELVAKPEYTNLTEAATALREIQRANPAGVFEIVRIREDTDRQIITPLIVEVASALSAETTPS